MNTGDFAQMIFSAQWDAERQTWKAAPGLVSSIFGGLRDLGGLDSWYPPDASDMAEYLTKNIVIAPDKESGAFIITFAHKDRSSPGTRFIPYTTWPRGSCPKRRSIVQPRASNTLTNSSKRRPT